MYGLVLGQSLNDLLYKHCDGLISTGVLESSRDAAQSIHVKPIDQEMTYSGTLSHPYWVKKTADFSFLPSTLRRYGYSNILVHYVDFVKLLSLANLDWGDLHGSFLTSNYEIYDKFFRIATDNSRIIPILVTCIDDNIITYRIDGNKLKSRGHWADPKRHQFALLQESDIALWQTQVFRLLASSSYCLIYDIFYAVHRHSYLAASKDLARSCCTLQCLSNEFHSDAYAYYVRLAYAGDIVGLGQEIKFILGAIVDTLRYCFPPVAGGSMHGIEQVAASFCREFRDGELSEVIERRFFSPLLHRMRASGAVSNPAAAW